ncbi:hypothetical protein COOONC_19682 [Cooperia oncophora]
MKRRQMAQGPTAHVGHRFVLFSKYRYTASGYGQGTALTIMSRQTSSVHDHMCLMLNTPKALIRAQSDEHLRSPIAEGNRKAPLSARVSSNEQDAAELARCQQNLERAYPRKKRALEMLVHTTEKTAIAWSVNLMRIPDENWNGSGYNWIKDDSYDYGNKICNIYMFMIVINPLK